MDALGEVWSGSEVANVGTASLGGAGCHRIVHRRDFVRILWLCRGRRVVRFRRIRPDICPKGELE